MKLLYGVFFFASLLSALEIVIQDIHLKVELADTPKLREKGLSGRKTLPDGTGMLFVYDSPQVCHFWMKDTLIPLSIGFFDENKRLIAWKDMPPPGESKLTLISSPQPCLYALEVPQGWFLTHKIPSRAPFKYVDPE